MELSDQGLFYFVLDIGYVLEILGFFPFHGFTYGLPILLTENLN